MLFISEAAIVGHRGHMHRNVLLPGCLLALLLATAALAASSTSGEFTVTPDSQYVNWTNNYTATLTITNNTLTNVVNVSNATSSIRNSVLASAPFSVYNGSYTNYNITLPSNVSIIFNTTGLAPGRYYGSITTLSSANSSENNINVSITLDVPLNVNASGYGSIRGNVSDNGFDFFYVNMSRVGAYGIRVNITRADQAKPLLILRIYDPSGSKLTTYNFTLTENTNNTNLTYNSAQTGYWLLNFTGSTSFNATVELLEGSLLADNSTYPTVYNRTNKGYNNTVQLNFWLNNSADYDVNISSIASSNYLNYSSYWMNITGISISPLLPYNLSANSGMKVTVTAYSSLSTTGSQTGNYTGQINFTSTGGYPNSTLSVNLNVQLNGMLDVGNVTAVNATGGNIVPGSFINVSVIPKWLNGTIVSNLDCIGNCSTNFTISITHQNASELSSTLLRSYNLNVNSAANNGTAYVLNVTLNSTALGGIYSMSVQVTENNSGTINTGSATGALTVSATALQVRIVDISDVSDLSTGLHAFGLIGQSKTIRGKVINYGAATANLVNLTTSLPSCVRLDPPGATGVGPLPTTPVNIAAGDNYTLSQYWNYTAISAASWNTCIVTLTGLASGAVWDRQSTTISFYVPSSAGGSSNQGSSGTGTGTNTSSNKTTTLTSDITLMDWPREVLVEQGKSVAKTVTIKNTGKTKQSDVKVSVDGLDSGWWSSTDKKTLAAGETGIWSVTFSVTNNTSISNHSFSLVASSLSVTARASSLLAVTPGADAQQEIRADLANYTSIWESLNQRIKGANATAVNATLQQALLMLESANASIAAGNWLSAYSALKAADAKLAEAASSFPQLGFALPGMELNAVTLGGAVGAIGAMAAGLYVLQRKGVIKINLEFLGIKQKPTNRVSLSPSSYGSPRPRKDMHPYSFGHMEGRVGKALEKLAKRLERADKRND